MAAKKWAMAEAVASHLVKVEPENETWWINLAYSVNDGLVYENLWYDVAASRDKCIQPDNTETFTGLKIFNNTFENNSAQVFANAGPMWSVCEARNNIVSRSGSNPWSGVSGFTQTNQLVQFAAWT